MPSLQVLNVLAFVSAILAIYFDYNGIQNLFDLFKPLTTILLILIPVIHGNKYFKRYLMLSITGFLFCLLGDILLLREPQFIWGLASFLIAHLLFTLSFISIDKFKFFLKPIGILITFGIVYYLFIFENLKDFAIPVLCYFAFIIVMCWQGISLFLWKKKDAFRLIAIGVTLFLVSDSIIAFSKFKSNFAFSGFLVLATYWLSIGLLANATVIIKKHV